LPNLVWFNFNQNK